MVCERWYVSVKVLYVKLWYCMGEMAFDILYVTLLYVKFVCVKLWYVREGMLLKGMWNYCMLSLCVWSCGMWERVCDILYVKLLYVKFVCERGYVTYCMLSLCVWERRREDEEEEEPGIQNQKQEPHTKLWGTILLSLSIFGWVAVAVSVLSVGKVRFESVGYNICINLF